CNVQLIIVGKQAARFTARLENINVLAAYTDFPEKPTANDIRPILNTITELFTNAEVDAVDAIFTDYQSSIAQVVKVDRVLPAAFHTEPVSQDLEAAVFEPSPQAVLETVTMRLIESQLNQIF